MNLSLRKFLVQMDAGKIKTGFEAQKFGKPKRFINEMFDDQQNGFQGRFFHVPCTVFQYDAPLEPGTQRRPGKVMPVAEIPQSIVSLQADSQPGTKNKHLIPDSPLQDIQVLGRFFDQRFAILVFKAREQGCQAFGLQRFRRVRTFDGLKPAHNDFQQDDRRLQFVPDGDGSGEVRSHAGTIVCGRVNYFSRRHVQGFRKGWMIEKVPQNVLTVPDRFRIRFAMHKDLPCRAI
jgi:hypothetical protein